MANLSNFAINTILNLLFRNTPYSQAATVYVALYTTNPTPADLGTEVPFTNGYSRKAVSFTSPSGGSIYNLADVVFDPATGSWGVVGFAAIRDAPTGGNMLAFGALATPKTINGGDVMEFNVGNIDVTAS